MTRPYKYNSGLQEVSSDLTQLYLFSSYLNTFTDLSVGKFSTDWPPFGPEGRK